MSDTKAGRAWAIAGVFALALTLGVFSQGARRTRAARPGARAVGEELRDAVAAPRAPATAGLAGRPVPTSWFKTPGQQHAEMDAMLMSSRRRRSTGRAAALQ